MIGKCAKNYFSICVNQMLKIASNLAAARARRIIVEEFLVYSNFLSSLLCVAKKSDPEIELRFILRQYNKRLKME